MLGEESGYPIEDDYKLMSIMKELVKAKKEYDRVRNALESVRETGYGMIAPTMEELKLDEPEMLRRGNQYGVRLHASGPQPAPHPRRRQLRGHADLRLRAAKRAVLQIAR